MLFSSLRDAIPEGLFCQILVSHENEAASGAAESDEEFGEFDEQLSHAACFSNIFLNRHGVYGICSFKSLFEHQES